MQPGQIPTEPFDFSLHNSNSAVCSYRRQKVHLYCRAAGRLAPSATRAGAGAGLRLARALISGRRGRGRLRPRTARAHAGQHGGGRPALEAGARCRSMQPAGSYTPTALMRVASSPAPMIPKQQCIQRQLRP